MGRADKIVVAAACVVIAAVGILAAAVQQNRLKNIEKDSSAVATMASRVKSLEASSKIEQKNLASENFYQKIRTGRSVNVLIIGDELIYNSKTTDEKGWAGLVANDLNKTYKSTFNFEHTKHYTSDVLQGLVDYNLKYTEDKKQGINSYDSIIVCFGWHDQNSLSIRDFHMIYDNLLAKLMKENPKADIILVLENTIKGDKDNGYTVDIKRLADYYGLDLINMSDAFANSGKSTDELMKDNYPTDEGYSLYSSEISKLIKKNIKANKTINYPKKALCFSDSSSISDMDLLTEGQKTGFKEQDGTFISSVSGDNITFDISGTIAYVAYNATAGGSFKVYLDNMYVGQFSEDKGSDFSTQLLNDFMTNGKHKIKIVTQKAPVTIYGVIANKG
ncbi:MAG TPA: SGNH/GDSL hydrolase family protein [Ruminiclostridium sp.]|nr:SGNH/GDSL hydrolase family protein [Ruminiclostridium sp.]